MGLLGNLLNAATSSGSPAADTGGMHSGLLQHVLGMAGDSSTGGLGGLVDKLKAGGLGSAVSSWVGNGPNQSVSPDQVQSALGSDQIQQLAQKFGLPASSVSGHLAQILPEVISHLTPSGAVPQQGELQSMLGMLRGKLSGG
jgi:uncharacterized protein YidB (DUF937 family)